MQAGSWGKMRGSIFLRLFLQPRWALKSIHGTNDIPRGQFPFLFLLTRGGKNACACQPPRRRSQVLAIARTWAGNKHRPFSQTNQGSQDSCRCSPGGNYPCLEYSLPKLKLLMSHSMAFGCCLPMKNSFCLSLVSHGFAVQPSINYARSNGLLKTTFSGLLWT